MRCSQHLFRAFVLMTFVGGLAPSVAHANITGFGDFSGFTVNVNDSGSAPTVSNGTLHLTNAGAESRSVFYDTPQNISSPFTASFTYQASGNSYENPGACFVLQNSTAGASAVGTGWLAYGGMTGKSLGVSLESDSLSGYYTDANFGGGSLSTSPVSLFSGDPINVTLTYNGTLLQESLLDTTTSASYNTSYLILTNFPAVLGGSTAYVGLTASGGFYGTNQYFSNFTFSTVPEPSTLALLGIGAVSLLAYAWRRRTRTA